MLADEATEASRWSPAVLPGAVGMVGGSVEVPAGVVPGGGGGGGVRCGGNRSEIESHYIGVNRRP